MSIRIPTTITIPIIRGKKALRPGTATVMRTARFHTNTGIFTTATIRTLISAGSFFNWYNIPYHTDEKASFNGIRGGVYAFIRQGLWRGI